MLRTVVYIRRSQEEKSEKQIQSIERQEDALREFVETHNNAHPQQSDKLSVDWSKDVFREEQTAKKPGRKYFSEMVQRVEKGKYDVILCTEPSRLSRNPVDTGILIHLMDTEKIEQIRTITSVFHSKSITERFTLNLFLSIAKYENDQRGENTSSGMQKRKADGGTTNFAPMGYKNAGSVKGAKFIEKDGENFVILRDMWELLLLGNYKISELYQMAKNRGLTRIKNHNGGHENRSIPTESTFRDMFRDFYYKGFIKSKKGIIKGFHPPMVTEEEFDKAQIILQKRGYKHSKITTLIYENLLENILQSGKSENKFYIDIKQRFYCKCGHRFYSKEKKPCPQCNKEDSFKKIEVRKYFSIRGEQHKILINGESKDVSNIPTTYIEELVQEELNKIHIGENLFQVIRRSLYTSWLDQEKKIQKEIKNKRAEIEELEVKRLNIVENAYGGKKPSQNANTSIDNTIDNIEDRINAIEEAISELRDRNSDAFEILWQSVNTLLNAKDVFSRKEEESFEPKRNMLLSVFSNLKFIDGKIIPEWQKPFDLIANHGALTKKSPSALKQKDSVVQEWLPG